MDIDIQRIPERGLHLDGTLGLDRDFLIEASAYLLEPIAYDLDFSREQGRVMVKGWLRTTLMLGCVRCLEEYELAVDSSFDLVLFPRSDMALGDVAIKEEESEYIFYEGNMIDLVMILSEQINLLLPFNPVCQSACKGLCVNCGTNLNEHSCRCDHSSSEISLLFDKIKR